jgi:hypothetical protein
MLWGHGLVLLCLSALWSADPVVSPAFQRLDLPEPTASTTQVLLLNAAPGTVVTTLITDCACIHGTTPLPATVPPSGVLELTLVVSGLRPGVKTVLIGTSNGIARAQVQVTGPGGGTGIQVLEAALAEATATGCTILGVVHDLRGQVRNCGCSTGSLGGAGILAHLPAVVHERAPTVASRWVLTGDVDGTTPGLGTALATQGWMLHDATIVVADDPLPELARTGLALVVTTGSSRLQHQRILRPALDRGMAVDLVLVNAHGVPVAKHVLPVDQTLGEVAGFTDPFPPPRTWTVVDQPSPSTACAGCHPAAFQAWAKSRHAHALESLPTADRHDACLACHVLPLQGTQVAAGVNCQSCHLGSEQHIAGAGQVKTTGIVDCRSCHDAQHHPAFQREKAWMAITHGK